MLETAWQLVIAHPIILIAAFWIAMVEAPP